MLRNTACWLHALLTVLLLAEHALGQLETAAIDYCSSLTASLCDEIDDPVGPVPKKCGSKICGFTIKTVKKSPCSAEQRTLLSRLLPMCVCSAQMQKALSQAPSLMQPGQVNVLARFTGVDDSVFNDVVAATYCLQSAGFPSADVNQLPLRSDLENDLQSLKPMAGVKKYTVVELMELEAGDLQVGMGKLQACRDGGAPVADPSSVTSVPSYCKDFVQWYDDQSAEAAKMLIPTVVEVQRQFINYLNTVVADVAGISTEVKRLVSPEPWQAVFQGAADQALVLDCDDPTTCYEGLLAGPWQALHDIANKLDGKHPALDVAAQAVARIKDFMSSTKSGFCDGTRKTKDVAYRQLSIYRAVWTSINAAGYDQDKLAQHPQILSDIMVYVSGMPLIPHLAVPTAAVRDVVAQLHDQVAAAVSDFQGRYQFALKKLAADNYIILSILNGNSPATCPDGANPQICPINWCNAAVNPVVCPGGYRCITDACSGCQAVCVPLPVSSSDAGNAVAIMQSWMDVIRNNNNLAKASDVVSSGLDNLMSSLDYLVSEGNTPGGRNFIYQSGLLTYNEVGKASGSFPCFQGVTRVCYSYKGFKKQCKLVPRVGACVVKKTWTMPNEHVPWVALHSGFIEMLFKAVDKLETYYTGSDPASTCP